MFLIFSKEKKEQMDDYIKRIKQCVRWFRQLEGNYVTEQENLRNLLEVAEKKCSDVGNGFFFLIGYSSAFAEYVFASEKTLIEFTVMITVVNQEVVNSPLNTIL